MAPVNRTLLTSNGTLDWTPCWDIWNNVTSWNDSRVTNCSDNYYPVFLGDDDEGGGGGGEWTIQMQRLHEFHIIKAIVLAGVIIIVLLSTCKMTFHLFVQYADKQEKP